MNYFIVLLAVALPGVAVAADDCTFDQKHQDQVLVDISKMSPGAETDVKQRQVTWTHPVEGTTTFAYGGCVDLGSEVTRSTALQAPRSQDQVFALAKELGERFWANKAVSAGHAAETLVSALDRSLFTVETIEGKTFFHVSDPGYVQLYVSHEYKDGVDTVSIAWQGNF